MIPLKRHLLFLVLGALVPLLVVAVALTVQLVREDRARGEAALHEHARLLAVALDGELSRSLTAMQALGLSEALRRGDLARFYAEAKEARDRLGLWDNVLLLSTGGEHMLNLMRPYGTKLPPVPNTEGPTTAARTRQPFISNALRGRVDTDWLMFMNYPVVFEGEVKYVLGVTMNYQYWSRWLAERAPKGYVASIVDRNHVILARTRDAEKLAGQQVQPWFRDVLAARQGGTVRGPGVQDADVVVGFHRSQLAGWHLNLFTTGGVIDAPGLRTAALLALGVVLALAIAVALALSRARALTGDIEGELGRLQGGLRAQADEQRRLNRELSAADRRKDEFLATLGHELRNPLAPIRTAAEILKHAELPAPAAEARAIIERQAMHMTRMVDDLLDAGRITRGELQLRREPVALGEAVRWAREAVQPAFDAAGVALVEQLPAEPLWLDADPTRLVQVLANLLGNAAKFTPRGGHAWIAARADGGQVEIRVRDDGAGIAAGQLPRLFQMFSQAEPALERARGGLGIGLALVRGLVERHGGTVEARSDGPGRGAEFIVRLPAAPAPAARAAAPRQPAEPVARRILVADDNRDAADSLASVLRAMGHEVHVVYDGEEALQAGERLRPDALVLDIGMPRVNGYDVAARARGTEWGRAARLIALTGWGQQADKERAARAGFDHHLTKPADAAAVAALLA